MVIARYSQSKSLGLEYAYSVVLNKYNTLTHHALLLTDSFVPQTQLLSVHDLAALYITLWWASDNAVGFYNSNKVAGASQRHKHMQVLPVTSICQLLLDTNSQDHTVDSVCDRSPLDEAVMPSIISKRFKDFPYESHDLNVENECIYRLPQVKLFNVLSSIVSSPQAQFCVTVF